jgi:hypothetical protein
LDSGLQKGQNIVVDGADRLRSGQPVIASTAHPRTGPGSGQASGHGGGPFGSHAGDKAGDKHDKRAQQ